MSTALYEVRLIDQATALPGAFLPDYQELSFSPAFSDIGSISFKYPTTGTNYALLAAEDAEIAVFVNGTEIEDGRFVLQDDDGDEIDESTEIRSFVGRTASYSYLGDGIVYPSTGSTTKADQTTFTNATAGTIIRTLLQRSQARNVSQRVTFPSFSNTTDSNGAAWSKVVSIAYDTGVSVLQVLQNLVDQGIVESKTVGQEIRLYNPDTLSADRTIASNPLVLRAGVDLKEAPSRRSTRELINVALVKGENDVLVERTDSTSLAARRRREGYVSQGGTSDAGTLSVIGDTQLALRSDPRLQKTVGIQFNPDSPSPWIDYFNGDYIAVDLGNGIERYRVRQITLTANSSGSYPEVALVLNDKMAEAEIRLARKVNGITGGATLGGGSSAQPAPPPATDLLAPSAPGTPSATSAAYVGPEGVTLAQATLSWPQVTTNTDSTAIDDLAGYIAEYSYGDTNWIAAGTTDATTTVSYVSGLRAGKPFSVRVRAFDKNGNSSAWSATYSLPGGLAADSTPPPVPSTPTLDTTFFGTIRATWDGLGSAGEAMPTDFRLVEVHASATSAFTPSASTLVDTLYAAGTAPIRSAVGSALYVRFVSVDRVGNKSAASTQASATATGISGLDIVADTITAAQMAPDSITASELANGSVDTVAIQDGVITAAKMVVGTITAASGILADAVITTAKIADAAILNAKIGNAEINDAKIASVSVGKLTAGTLAADVTISARIKTANTGARVELNSSGLQAFNSGGTQTVAINAADGSVTLTGAVVSGGTITGSVFQTATSGERIVIDSGDHDRIRLYTGYTGEIGPAVLQIYRDTFDQPYSYGVLYLTCPTLNSAADYSQINIASSSKDGTTTGAANVLGHTVQLGGFSYGTLATVTSVDVTSDYFTAPRARIGGGAIRGTDYAAGYHNATFTVNNAAWQSLGWNSKSAGVEDDGTMWSGGSTSWATRAAGFYTAHLTVGFASNGTGLRGVRFLTQGGSVVGNFVTAATNTANPSTNMNEYASGGGYYYTPQCYQSSGAGLGAGPNSATGPTNTRMAQVA